MDRGFAARGGTAPVSDAPRAVGRDQVDDRRILAEVFVECRPRLLHWLGRERSRRHADLDAAVDSDDLLSEASARAIKALPALRGRAPGQFVQLVKKILHDLMCDEARHLRCRNRRVGIPLSLDRDSAAARLAEFVTEDRPSAEAEAARSEVIAQLRRALKRLPQDESRVVRGRMCGWTWEQIEGRFGSRSRRLWQRALSRLRTALADETARTGGRERRLVRKPR